MAFSKQLPIRPILASLIAVSLFVGWFIPAYYDWTGSDQSRPSPLIWQTALGLFLGSSFVCLSLPWLKIGNSPSDNVCAAPIQFGIRTLLALMLAVAVILAALVKNPVVASGLLGALTFGYVLKFWVGERGYRWQTAALLACMLLPYVWILAHNERSTVQLELLWMTLGLPALLPTMFIGTLVGQHPNNLAWLSVMLASGELLLGIWIIRLGPKRTLAYLLAVLLTSTFGSFVLNALVRM